MFKRTILALTAAAVTITGVAQAQESATLTLTSGEKLAAELVDLGGTAFYVRVNGAKRSIPKNDVAVIDFGGGSMSEADWAKVPTGQQVVMLKSGEAVNGQLYDLGRQVASESDRQDRVGSARVHVQRNRTYHPRASG